MVPSPSSGCPEFQTAYANYFHCTRKSSYIVITLTQSFKPLTRIIFTARASCSELYQGFPGVSNRLRELFSLHQIVVLRSKTGRPCFKPLTRIIFTARRYPLRCQRPSSSVSNRLRELFSLHQSCSASKVTAHSEFQTAYANYFHCTAYIFSHASCTAEIVSNRLRELFSLHTFVSYRWDLD